jgi:UDPglucose 6-dehydrogenase
MARAGELGVDETLTFLREVDSINLRRRGHVADLARKGAGGSVRNKRIAVLGAAFKPNSDDVRDSPALHVAAELQQDGADIAVYDPKANTNAASIFPTLDYVDSIAKAIQDADIVMLLTEWQEFQELDPADTAQLVAQKVMVDGRLCLDPEAWRAAGWTYLAPGRPAQP